jgi:hypothetical protein
VSKSLITTKSPVIQEMLRCLDARVEVLAFAKTHRPEERAKLAAADQRLADLRAQYPVTWQLLQRRVKEGRL